MRTSHTPSVLRWGKRQDWPKLWSILFSPGLPIREPEWAVPTWWNPPVPEYIPWHSGHAQTRHAVPCHAAGTAMPTESLGSATHLNCGPMALSRSWHRLGYLLQQGAAFQLLLGRRKRSPLKTLPKSCFPVRLCTILYAISRSIVTSEYRISVRVSLAPHTDVNPSLLLLVLPWW